MDIKKLHELYKSGQKTVVQYTNEVLQRIKDNDLNSFITLNTEKALEKAQKLDEMLKSGYELTPLFGVPLAVKDNILTKGLRTTSASQSLDDFIPVYDATVMEKINKTDAILIGKANMDEFAMGGSSETSYYGSTVNPFDKKMIPGGSSSGSAAAVAGDEVVVSLGSDTGGSVRNPANYCNVVGFAPTYGAISRYGVISMANSFDRVGVLGNTVSDVRVLFDAVKGLDENDFTSVEINDTKKIESLEGVKIAYAKMLDEYQVDEEIIKHYEKSLDVLRQQGAILEEVELKHLTRISQVYTIIMCVEVASNMARVDGIRYGSSHTDTETIDELYRRNRSDFFGEEINRRIALGNYFASKQSGQLHYRKAMQVRTILKEMFENLFSEYDYFISPTNTQLPYEVGSKLDDANAAYDSGMFNTIANIIDLPSISIPVDKEHVGSVQFIGTRKNDYELLDVAEIFERSIN
ncbi:MAG: Asp-tRNA(Asn)/Glu-tRNA(Gln) amidotransferase subunit GatA [Tissierellia bacterium]|nr:Asp-tRNA(Asn)/Glu-tRNA(Gln) amidotransferase subunit GatA [Tissierellia bacterium]